MERPAGEGAEPVIDGIGERPPDELAREVPGTHIEQQRPLGRRPGDVLPVGAGERARDSVGGSEAVIVLEGLIVQQALLQGAQGEEAQRLAASNRNRELPCEVVGLAAVVGQDPGTRAPRIAHVGWSGGAHRVGVEPPRRVHHGDEADATPQRPVGLRHHPVETVVPAVGGRTVGLVGGAAPPAIPAVLGDDVDQSRQGLPVARRETVGDERRLLEDVGGHPHAERAGGGVELVLHPQAVEDERLLPQPPAAVALADAPRGERDPLVDARYG